MPSKTADTGSEMVWERDGSATKEDRENIRRDSKGLEKRDATDCTQHWEDPEHLAQNQKEYKKFQENSRRGQSMSKDSQDQDQPIDGASGKKRGRGANAATTNKKQKSSAGNHDEPTGTAGDKTRVPEQGQKVHWKAQAGCVDGEVVEVIYEEKKVNGKKVEASKEDPRIVLKSDLSGKTCVHRPEDVYFD